MAFVLAVLFFVVLFIVPVVIWLWSFNENNYPTQILESNFSRDDQLTGFKRLVDLQFDTTNDETDTTTTTTTTKTRLRDCGNFFYLGAANKWQNCSQICQNRDYEYKYVYANQNAVLANRRLVGAYCLPKDVAACNLNTSYALVGINGYKCVSRFPQLFGGHSGNEIVGCHSRRLRDNMLNVIYEEYIPPGLVVRDLDERMPDGRYRFECVLLPNEIRLPADYGSRFESELNVCGLNDNYRGRLDFEAGMCTCKNYAGGNKNNLCTMCVSGWEITSLTPNVHGQKYAYTVGRDCVDIDDDVAVDNLTRISITEQPSARSHLTSRIPIPCGHSTMKKIKLLENDKNYDDVTNKSCEHAILYATNTYTPPALENMYK